MSGTPFGPGALPNGILELASITSAMVTSRKNYSEIRGGHFMITSGENKASIIGSYLPGSVSPGIVLFSISFLVTILYGDSHESVST